MKNTASKESKVIDGVRVVLCSGKQEVDSFRVATRAKSKLGRLFVAIVAKLIKAVQRKRETHNSR